MQPTLDAAYWIGLVISFVLPLLVGLVTTHVTHPGLKAAILLFLTAANGFLVELTNAGDDYNVSSALILWAVSFVTSVAAHFGLWKPTGAAAKAQAVGVKSSSPSAV
ncbi:hypothetical protein [Streptomyces longwoodensis]|uniref:hypothetical protein n=1 Tax=Streptomyces longwoodensis TaxID=68231 RepID=UPI0022551B8C|nr:hypothetical protein [Streptomyces longwoodensis]MCX5000978.1 hypothetical protein [Streptomyces longwoodensis]